MTRRAGNVAEIDWQRLGEMIRVGVRFLDDVIEIGRWPDARIEQCVRANRKIGLGVMGFAEMLIELGIPYESADALSVADDLASFFDDESLAASEELARQRGDFPNWATSVHARQGRHVRNATRLSIAPTGTISMIAATSGGIEPLFALAYRRQNILEGETMTELNPVFHRVAQSRGLDLSRLTPILHRDGTLASATDVPSDVRSLLRTALEISPQDHLNIQAAFQRHVDNAVSKTVNLPHAASIEAVEAIYRQAGQLGLKGVTIYRYGSKDQQVFNLGTGETSEEYENFAACDPDACRV